MERFLRLSAAEATEALRPALVKGKWQQPRISKRKLARVKKEAEKNGLMGQWVPGQGGWLPEWESMRKHHVMRPPKGTKNERTEFDRVRKVQAALEDMPNKIEAHKKAVAQSKPLKGLDKWLADPDDF